MATLALPGWHPGEVAVQRKLGFAEAVRDRFALVENFMREQHRIFHTSNLPFIPVTTIDDQGRPWGSLVAGPAGQIGFVKSPDVKTLTIDARLWDGEPMLETARAWLDEDVRFEQPVERFLTAGLGIEFTTRRRNKFAGRIRGVKKMSDRDYRLDLAVTETLGNCPKYINIRKFVPHPNTNPKVEYRQLHMDTTERLPDEVIKFITEADTVFVGSVYKGEQTSASIYPSHAGMNARGGLPGFVRVKPSDGRSIVLPDYSGNRFMSSLGNIESSGMAALTIVSFTTGDVLYLTGKANILVGEPALAVMARHASITVIETTGYTFVRDAFPMRQQPGTKVEQSPYSPKVKYLVDEPEAQAGSAGGHKARLTSAIQLSSDLAVFSFNVKSRPGVPALRIRPGQAVVLDFMDWIGPPKYSHMANHAPGSINDDRVRTWTVSSAHEGQDATTFELTMREMEGGAVTGALFDVLRRHPRNTWGKRIDIAGDVVSDIVGISGDFFLGQDNVNMLWIAGGIGITPFLSMLSALSERETQSDGDIVLALATREPDLMLGLIESSLHDIPLRAKLQVDIFAQDDKVDLDKFPLIRKGVVLHKGRIRPEYWAGVARDRDVLICGPGGFGDAAEEGLRAVGVPNERVLREGFY